MSSREKDPKSYICRDYRELALSSGLVSTYVSVEETDLHILAKRDVGARAQDIVVQNRLQIEKYISENPSFLTSLKPMRFDPLSPVIVREMMKASDVAGVGPMATVAGAVAGVVGEKLALEVGGEVIVENGGDVFLLRKKECVVSIFAGQSTLSKKVGLRISENDMPLGICTSSGTIGHSLSLGVADSVTVLSRSIALADAAATRLGNEIGGGGKKGINHALSVAAEIEGLIGVVAICGENIGAMGNIELVQV